MALLLDEPIKFSKRQIEQANSAYQGFIVPLQDWRSIAEAVTFSIVTAGNNTDLSMGFIHAANDKEDDFYADAHDLHRFARYGTSDLAPDRHGYINNWGADSPENNRFQPMWNWLTSTYDMNLPRFSEEFRSNPQEMRRELVDLKYIGPKTASMMHLCLAGTKPILTIDRHVKRTTYEMGVEEMKDWLDYKKHLAIKPYERLEQAVLNHCADREDTKEFYSAGQAHGGRLTTLLFLSRASGKKRPDRVIVDVNNESLFESMYSASHPERHYGLRIPKHSAELKKLELFSEGIKVSSQQ